MPFVSLTSDSPGAPTLNGVNGSLCAVLDWALVQAGWTILYSSGNARVYQTVSGRLLHVNHDSAVSGNAMLAVIRGCEGASDATTLIDPFPTVGQLANNTSNWIVSNAAGATAKWYRIYANNNWLLMCIDTNSAYTSGPPSIDAAYYGGGMFGEPMTQFPSPHNCIVFVRGASSTSPTTSAFAAASPVTTGFNTNGVQMFWQRTVDGSVKSSRATLALSGGNPSSVNNAPALMGGYQNRIYREPVAMSCMGTATQSGAVGAMALLRRGYLPQMWSALHAGYSPLTGADTFEDSNYNPAALFRPVGLGTTGWLIEETDTWNPY